MFDTMTITKAVGAFCGAFLIFLLGGWAAEALYHVGGGHGEEEQAYVIDVPESEGSGGGEAAAEDPPVEELLASADVGSGERIFGKCKACHKLEAGANGTGPTLHNVVGRPVDSIDGYAYSGALEKVADVWTPENLYHFLKDPKGYAPGTKMGFAGLPKPEDRANVIAYLQSTEG
ncbi:c-type cytochrome [Oceaniglobus roseus]|uniref:c-type cytochrome n=1 Tax=Oceaniglobus roseus TaxID=1737570 RepID=UPI000C7F326C|nr:cytochrome c family protein [Kandeliimicrobium roseum]